MLCFCAQAQKQVDKCEIYLAISSYYYFSHICTEITYLFTFKKIALKIPKSPNDRLDNTDCSVILRYSKHGCLYFKAMFAQFMEVRSMFEDTI